MTNHTLCVPAKFSKPMQFLINMWKAIQAKSGFVISAHKYKQHLIKETVSHMKGLT